ncbi:MAG: hypothetical protein VB118_01065 [Oscillospiraceae bacterium]|nr:hypothetical protein [Oscillospiraceae bacterium]
MNYSGNAKYFTQKKALHTLFYAIGGVMVFLGILCYFIWSYGFFMYPLLITGSFVILVSAITKPKDSEIDNALERKRDNLFREEFISTKSKGYSGDRDRYIAEGFVFGDGIQYLKGDDGKFRTVEYAITQIKINKSTCDISCSRFSFVSEKDDKKTVAIFLADISSVASVKKELADVDPALTFVKAYEIVIKARDGRTLFSAPIADNAEADEFIERLNSLLKK